MTDNSNNVIYFPKKYQMPPFPEVPNAVDIKANVDNLYKNNIEAVIPPLVDFILDQLVAAGFKLDFTTDQYLKELCMVVESLKGLLYKYYSLDHPLQGISDTLFVVDDKVVRYKNKEQETSTDPILMDEEDDEEDFDGYI